jgi:ubiquinone/menaquinone biosynthesis C-methylase UbiE
LAGSTLEYNTYHTHHLTGIGEYLPLNEGEFDVVIATNVLDHTQNPTKVVSEIKRVLKQKGVLILSMNTFNLPKLVRSRIFLIDREHPHHYTYKEVLSFLKDAGVIIKMFRKRSLIHDSINTIKQGHIRSGLKLLFAGLLGGQESFYVYSKSQSINYRRKCS